MKYANITGWGKALPPAILSNDDLATFLDTDDNWITSRTGMKERRISHVTVSELAYVACEQALAAAGKTALDVDLIVFGSTTFDEFCPNAASNVQRLLGANNAGCMDVNTACTSGMYSFSVANAMIRSGAIKSALVIGAEVISPLMDWTNRDVAVLFGDGAAAFYLEASDEENGVVAERLGCYGDSRGILSIEGWGTKYFNEYELAVVSLPENWTAASSDGTLGVDHICHPMAINNKTDCNRVLIVRGHQYALLYRYESWVQYISKPTAPRVDLTKFAEELTAQEPAGAIWTFDGIEKIYPVLAVDPEEESLLEPNQFLARLIKFLETNPGAWDPYDEAD